MSLRLKNLLILGAIAIFSTAAVWAGTGMTKVYENFDGPYYLVVARTWYDKNIIRTNFAFPTPLEYYPAHFPLYPLLIDLVSFTGLDHPQSMAAVNLIAGLFLTAAIYLIFEKKKWGNPFWAALTSLFWWPRMWAVRSVGSPETLFILAVVLSLYWFSEKKYWLSAFAGIAAVLTKSPGILLLFVYGWWWKLEYFKNKKINLALWPVFLLMLALVGLFGFYRMQTGDFWAYFHSGDNIHLQILPFKVFNSDQPWVGTIWLEDILWIYLIGGIGVFRAWQKDKLWGLWGVVFLTSIFFVSHRDISRYSLPLVPVVLLGLSEIFERKEVRWALVLIIVPMYFYTLNFMTHNVVAIADWRPFW